MRGKKPVKGKGPGRGKNLERINMIKKTYQGSKVFYACEG